MRLELNNDGSVLNRYSDADPRAVGEWYPDDTELVQIRAPNGLAPVYVSPPERQAPDWPQRAARSYDAARRRWERTGAAPTLSPREQALANLRAGPLDDTAGLAQVRERCNELRLILMEAK